MRTHQQEWAEKAFRLVSKRKADGVGEEYARTSKTFPALIHNSGLCQAVAFAQARSQDGREGMRQYLDDLADMMGKDQKELARSSRSADVLSYQHLTWDAIAAASWLERYAETLLDGAAGANETGSSVVEEDRGE